MRNYVRFLFVIFAMAALSSFLIPNGGTLEERVVTSSHDATLAELFNNKAETVLSDAEENPAGKGAHWFLVAKKSDDAGNGDDAEEEEGENDQDNGGGGFDRLWDRVCCG
jgi:hypothetical protein